MIARIVAVVFVVVAAGGACNESAQPPITPRSGIPDSANQMMLGSSLILTDAGVRKASVKSDTVFTYDDNTRFELRKVTTDFFTVTGERNGTLTSREGTHNVRLGVMEARGNVVVVTTDGRRLETQQLKYDPSRNEISSDSAFVMTEKQKTVSGIGFISDPNMNSFRILKGAKSTGQEVTIPKR
jgi:LPS export ABC transporter protein LptC